MTTFRFHSAAGLALLAAAVAGLSAAPPAADEDRPIRALLVIGGCCHDYKKQKDLLTRGVSARANVQWVIAYDPSTAEDHLNPVYEKEDWAKAAKKYAADVKALAKAVDDKDDKAIEKSLKTINASCKSCHTSHKGK